MIDDHSNGTSCSIHGRSRVDEALECLDKKNITGSVSGAAAIPSCMPGNTAEMIDTRSSGRVAVLMCTCNGQDFLEEQLQSIARQSYGNWHVAISDDGSRDATLNIANRYRYRWGEDKVSLWQGPCQGFARNFISFICNRELHADFYAWCDQDDIWDQEKLQAAVTWLSGIDQDIPALYLGRTELISEGGAPMGYSPLFRRPASFANALVQNIGGGNTMVLNQAARALLQEAGEHLPIVSHDWWAYLLVTGVGGRVFYDPRPYVRYRQHGGNLVGSNIGWAARLVRLSMLFKGRFRSWNQINIAGLETIRHRLTEENRLALDRFKALRAQGLAGRLLNLKRSGVYRQTLLGNLGLIMAAVIKEI
ncbi:MAG TPA: glycosyltransferase family 2 protein [Pseudomonas sp.]|jgi:glycosyltransferase involved in cell wall biosynthesis|uniref:glycosyltransferase family 2 protein n=1 Tax=Pseudomonas sp. TaxID=306 RepID=UPI002EDAE227